MSTIQPCAAALCAALALGGCRAEGPTTLLWDGATVTKGDRDRAVARGLAYIFATAENAEDFSDYGSDYLWCFYSIAAATSNARLRQSALNYGRILARRWRDLSHGDLAVANAETVSDLAMAVEASEALGIFDPDMRHRLERRLPEFTVQQMLGFDPTSEPPPTREIVLTGAEACAAAGLDDSQPDACSEVRRTIPDPDIWYDALIATYFGDRFGVPFGASFAELMAWRDELLPYRDRAYLGEVAWYDQAYMVTHLVYTHNDYGQRRLDPAMLPEEYAFLLRAFEVVLVDDDAETFAEFVDTLKAFGHTPLSDADMARAIEAILASQNADGSWGQIDGE
ncbi:MAG: hypothetical protein V3T05_03130, partial [Myxococcota bacterium]